MMCTLGLTQDGKALICIRNSNGPRIVPWGTHNLTVAAENAVASRTTLLGSTI